MPQIFAHSDQQANWQQIQNLQMQIQLDTAQNRLHRQILNTKKKTTLVNVV